ncbi:MAG: alpha/beta fold hydrolase [Cellvibrio sp.]|nr:alpha/beta fold hydrolase [Cellvibrio sp.]
MKLVHLLLLISIATHVFALDGTLEQQPGQSSQQPPSVDTTMPACVILLHGLARTSQSMLPLGEQLHLLDYVVINVDYPSREFPIAALVEKAITPALEKCRQYPISGIHFVTHSLGGILVRYYLSQQKIPELKRVVMMAPPNKGSQVVDNLRDLPPYNWLNGPAGRELGTDPASVPNTLGEVNFDLGVIAGTTSINILLSLYLPDPDDGKVSVENTKIEGMRDFISLPVSHPYIMKDKEAIAQTIHFLRHGTFLHAPAVINENKEF